MTGKTAKAGDIPFSVWRKIAMATWRPRTDPTISATVDVDAEKMLEYIKDVREATGAHVTPVHVVGRAVARVFEAMPGLNGRVVMGGFVPSPTIDGFFVVSLKTEMVEAREATATDLSGSVVRNIDTKEPWVIAQELTDRAAAIRADKDPAFKQTKALMKLMPPPAIKYFLDGVGFVTESLQLPVPLLGLEARPYGSFLISNVGTYGLDTAFAPVPVFCKVPVMLMVGAVTDKVVARDGQPVVRPMLPIAVGIDHRFVDGYQAAAVATIFREYLENPATFDPVPAKTAAPTSKAKTAKTVKAA